MEEEGLVEVDQAVEVLPEGGRFFSYSFSGKLKASLKVILPLPKSSIIWYYIEI